jgi:Dehydrogenases with different specificities (related to short-chain alcohol dehydrogenases)
MNAFEDKAAPALSHYAASKAAVEHMTRCWALELAPDRVRVNAIAAGPAETDFLVERMGLSMEQAERVKANERIAFRSVAGATPTKLRDGSFRSHPRQRLGSPVRSSRSMAV